MIIVTRDDFSIDEVIRKIRGPDVGAVVTFLGTVRGESAGRVVERMEVQAYEEMATRQLERIEAEALKKFDVKRTAIIHRTGVLKVSDNIVLIVVGAPHRDEAFKACRFIIEELKKTVPLWKKEYTATGENWVLSETHGEGI
jgi:molybdopterin synthase catalytic subunit